MKSGKLSLQKNIKNKNKNITYQDEQNQRSTAAYREKKANSKYIWKQLP